jgi:hypothetical protein
MLWMKGWLETRARLFAGLGLLGFSLISAWGITPKSGLPNAALHQLMRATWVQVLLFAGMVAGAGIATQPALQATKGLHGSQLFTLALPVSRLRLLAVRSAIGWLELAGGVLLFCAGLWLLFPIVRQQSTPMELLEHAAALIACSTGIYAIPVVLATFLDDQWRLWGSALITGALFWLFENTALPQSMNIFRAMGEASPLMIHSVPWMAMTLSMVLAVGCFFLALRIARVREY